MPIKAVHGNPRMALTVQEKVQAREAIRYFRSNNFPHIELAKIIGVSGTATLNWYQNGAWPSKKFLGPLLKAYEDQKTKPLAEPGVSNQP